MASSIVPSKSIVQNYETKRKTPNIPSWEMLYNHIKKKNSAYPYDDNKHVLAGANLRPDDPVPVTLTYGPEAIIHQTKSIHLAATKKLTFAGRFMAAPVIKLEAQVIELTDSNDQEKPITTIVAQTRLVLNAWMVFLNGVDLRCNDAAIDFRAKIIRYANIDLQELKKTAQFRSDCKFLKAEPDDD